MLHRGYDEYGNRVAYKVKFQPVLYVPTKKKTGIYSIDGTELEEHQFDSISHAKEFFDQYQGIDNFSIYGNQSYLAQYLLSIHPDDIEFNKEKVNITTIDIEVDSSDGFPHPEQAAYEVNAITLHHTTDDTFYVFGLKEYDVEKSIVRDTNRVIYKQCKNEADLLQSFIVHWSFDKTSPDIITGWNSRSFDIPYLVNRITKVLGEKSAQRLSPWGIVKNSTVRYKNKTLEAYDIFGIQQIDYLDIFQKFTLNTLGTQESYRLDHIAHVVLGDNKLSYEEHSTLANLYKEDHQKYIDYNIKDTQLVQRFEDKLGLIGLVMTMAYRGGVNYTTTLGTTAIWDSIIYRDLASKNLVVPPAENKIKGEYPGAYVKDPQVGMHNWVTSFDLNSLYPSIIVQWNMSPETLLSDLGSLNVDKALREELPDLAKNTTIAANGAQFKTDKEGIIPTIVKTVYSERRILKKKMLEAEQKLEYADKSDKQLIYSIERDISIFKTEQMALKILLNSLYGALGNRHFRYTNLTVAEAITLTGQMVIKWIERDINVKMNDILKTDDDYVIAIDTDSTYVNFSKLVEKFEPKNPIDFLDSTCKEVFEPEIKKSYERLFNVFKCYERRMEMTREVIADRGIWTAKKRYILNVYDNEGVRYSKPKMKIVGIEAIKSSTPQACREALKEIFKVIITGSQEKTNQAIEAFKTYFSSLPAEEVAFPRGVSELDKWSDKKTRYKKGTPINSRAAIIHNDYIDAKKLNKKYQKIQEGDKIKFSYLRMPNPTNENVIAFIDYLPPEFQLNNYIDYDKQFEKTFLAPITPIFEAIGWSTDNKQSLEDFFV